MTPGKASEPSIKKTNINHFSEGFLAAGTPSEIHSNCEIRFATVNRIDQFSIMRTALFPILLAFTVFATAVPGRADTPQAKLPTITLTIGSEKLTTEVADETSERNAGMMFRDSMADGDAMLFVMDSVGPVSFWMKNTTVPLSIAYVNSAGIIMEIHDLQPLDETSVDSEFSSIAFAIEVPQGYFSRVGIYPGTLVEGLPRLTEN